MKVLLLFTFLIATSVDAQKKVVCYWFTEADIAHVNPNICTHIIYSFLGLDAQGNLNHLHRAEWHALQLIASMVNLKNQNPNLVVMAAIGGYNPDLESEWYRMAENSQARLNFARNIHSFVVAHRLDGIDIDWEYPNYDGTRPQDKENFNLVLRAIKDQMRLHLVTAAIGAGQWRSDLSYDLPTIFQICDFVNLMSYDLHGGWNDRTGIHGALFQGPNDPGVANVDASVFFILNQGISRTKLIVGIPAYGITFQLNDTNSNGVGAAAHSGGDALHYFTICQNVNSGQYTTRWEYAQRVPYAFRDANWVGYDDIRSVSEKARYINQHALGGAMFWSIDADDHRNLCGTGNHPLITNVFNILRN